LKRKGVEDGESIMGDISKELVEKVVTAREEGRALNIVGGGSKSFFGRTAEGEPLEVAGHSGIISYNPIELVITARCGTTMEEIKQALAEHGQVCPFESPVFAGRATLGGTLACNFSGPARPCLGSIRDAVLGTRLINGKGEEMKFGGQVMKNVAGYDVSRLQAGALGTLGVITEISMKVLPIPAATATVAMEMDVAESIGLMNRVAGQPAPLSGSAWVDGKLYLRFEGAASAVEGAVKKFGGEVMEESSAFWEGVTEQTLDFFQGDAPLWRLSVKSNAPHIDAGGSWLVDWGGAQRWLRGDFDKAELERQASEAGGHLSLFRYGDRSGEVFHTASSVQQRLQKNLKAAFDPDRILNPGRLYSWL